VKGVWKNDGKRGQKLGSELMIKNEANGYGIWEAGRGMPDREEDIISKNNIPRVGIKSGGSYRGQGASHISRYEVENRW